MINPDLTLHFEEITPPQGTAPWIVHWKVPADLTYFEGHFPENPILPAVGILDVTLEALRRSSPSTPLALKGVKSAKFLRPIAPDQTIEIRVTQRPDGQYLAIWAPPGKSESLAEILFQVQIDQS